jgi:hypothetical protein
MASITIFSTPKPFTEPHINLIQRNAIQSWLQLGEETEVLLIGEEEGLAEVAEEFDIRSIKEVRRNEFGTPLISSLFEIARETSGSDILVYINADIILLPGFQETVQEIAAQEDRFLTIGYRWDLDVLEPIDYSPGWAEDLRQAALENGKRRESFSIDFFVFPAGLYMDVPDFAVGRAGWDNWMIYHACDQGWSVIDISPSMMVIHQNHHYNHLPGGKTSHGSAEAIANREAAGGRLHFYNLQDVTHEFRDGRVRRARWSLSKLVRRLERWIKPEEARGKRSFLARQLYHLWLKLEEIGL